MLLRWLVFGAPMASIWGSKVQYSRLRGQYFRLQDQYFKLHGQYFSSEAVLWLQRQYYSSIGRILVLSLRYCPWSQSTTYGAKVLAMELEVLALEPKILASEP